MKNKWVEAVQNNLIYGFLIPSSENMFEDEYNFGNLKVNKFYFWMGGTLLLRSDTPPQEFGAADINDLRGKVRNGMLEPKSAASIITAGSARNRKGASFILEIFFPDSASPTLVLYVRSKQEIEQVRSLIVSIDPLSQIRITPTCHEIFKDIFSFIKTFKNFQIPYKMKKNFVRMICLLFIVIIVFFLTLYGVISSPLWIVCPSALFFFFLWKIHKA